MPVLRRLGCSVLALGLLAGCAPPRTGPASSPTNNGAKADAVIRIVRDFMTQAHLKAVLVRVTVAGKEVVTRAVGDSMTGVPATTAMHFATARSQSPMSRRCCSNWSTKKSCAWTTSCPGGFPTFRTPTGSRWVN